MPKTPISRLLVEPEFEDTGCKESPSCLACPLVKCVEDMTLTERERWKTHDADMVKVQEFTEALKSMRRQAAARFVAAKHGIQERTVQRIVARVEVRRS